MAKIRLISVVLLLGATLFFFSRSTGEIFIAKNSTQDSLEVRVSRIPLSHKVGQLIMLGLADGSSLDAFLPLVREEKIGGIIIMGGNVRATKSIPDVLTLLQTEVASTSPETSPLFMATDQEGGVVSRFRGDGFTSVAQFEITSTSSAREVAVKRGKELRTLGLNMNFAPVMDAADSSSFLYSRTFRGDQAQIAALGIAMMDGYRESGIIAVPKHFPGHPEYSLDSHRLLPVAEGNREWWEGHIAQFKMLLKESPEMLMTAHVSFPALAPDYPATLSKTIITDELRHRLGFDGVIITDDVKMGAIASNSSLAEASVRAIEAGNDIVLIVGSRKDAEEAYRVLNDALAAGRLSESRINESVVRIIRLKQKI